MTIGVLGETGSDDRVAITPDNIAPLQRLGISTILVEEGAGKSAFFSDRNYLDKGATIASRQEVLDKSELLLFINGSRDIPKGKVAIGSINPLSNPDLVEHYVTSGATVFSLDIIPRTTRAQSMDVLSSMATLAGYKAVLTAASHLPKFFPMLMTAAGTVKPAKVLILGAGVAGLQAISTSRRLGALVDAFDVRKAAKEEVLSLGGKFIDVEGAEEDSSAGGYAIEQSEEYKKKQEALVAKYCSLADVIITTAQIPGKRAPLLIRKETVEKMKPGSVIVDLASSTGGNCELSKDGETILHKGIIITGNSHLEATMPSDASKMFGNNIINFVKLIVRDGKLNLNFNDELVDSTCITIDGKVHAERIRNLMMAKS